MDTNRIPSWCAAWPRLVLVTERSLPLSMGVYCDSGVLIASSYLVNDVEKNDKPCNWPALKMHLMSEVEWKRGE